MERQDDVLVQTAILGLRAAAQANTNFESKQKIQTEADRYQGWRKSSQEALQLLWKYTDQLLHSIIKHRSL